MLPYMSDVLRENLLPAEQVEIKIAGEVGRTLQPQIANILPMRTANAVAVLLIRTTIKSYCFSTV